VAGAVRLGNTVSAAVTSRRVLEPVEAHIAIMAGALLAGIAVLALTFPRGVAYPLAIVAAWLAAALLVRGLALLREQQRRRRHRRRPAIETGSGS
jgi:cardiolipin synthase